MKHLSRRNWVLGVLAVAMAVFVAVGIRPSLAAVDLRNGNNIWHWFVETNVYPGASIAIQGAVSNAGSTGCSAFNINFYVSSDTTITTGDRYLGTYYMAGGMSAWSSQDFLTSFNQVVPATTPPGTYYVGYIIDSSYIITESNEGNNSVAITSRRLIVFNRRPNTPSGTSPANGATGQSLTPTLTASAFSDPDVGQTHTMSRWIVDNNSDWSSPVYETGDTTVSKTSLTIPAGRLSANTKYYWTVAYKDNYEGWSYHSSGRYFTTGSSGGTVVYPAFNTIQRLTCSAVNKWSFLTAWNLSTSGLEMSASWYNGSFTWEHTAAGSQQWIARFAYDQGTGKTTALAWYYRQAHVQ